MNYPAGYGKLIPKGATLHFQLHYTPNGQPRRDRTKLGLIFAKNKPKYEVRTTGILNHRLVIPPRAGNHQVTARIPVPVKVQLLSLLPHMHLRGKAFRYDLILPNGQSYRLLDVPKYDFNWQLGYRYKVPFDVPAGSQIKATGWFDNSSSNPANPNPAATVRWGKQTYEEMMIGYIEYVIRPR